ncbi:MAG: hypothetical protein IJB96_07495 [Lachnospira sp.]|nr:hypothetical protein [Lachnospira sp.]
MQNVNVAEDNVSTEKIKRVRKPISRLAIYKMMVWVTVIAAGVFFLKNVIGKNIAGVVVIGLTLVVFGATMIAMRVKKVESNVRELVVSVSIVFMIFLISLFSGASYSDDFSLYLACIGMAGLYMETKITRIQILLSDVCLILMYIIHPEKSGGLSQYILCVVVFMLAAELFYQTIKRGKAFVAINDERAVESENVLASMREMGDKLQEDFEKSSARIDDNTKGLQKGSASIVDRTNEIAESCENVHGKIVVTEQNINELNGEVRKFELALNNNRESMEAMTKQLKTVSDIVNNANSVFEAMQLKMEEVSKITEQINNISFNTTTLSFNASIEAARAGEAGIGFEVVAQEMRKLSVTSTQFSEKVTEVVGELREQVAMTSEQLIESRQALDQSDATMKALQNNFENLTEQFGSLYENIEEQNCNVMEVDSIFRELNSRVGEMSRFSVDNQKSVAGIVEAMDAYKVNIGRVIENTRM